MKNGNINLYHCLFCSVNGYVKVLRYEEDMENPSIIKFFNKQETEFNSDFYEKWKDKTGFLGNDPSEKQDFCLINDSDEIPYWFRYEDCDPEDSIWDREHILRALDMLNLPSEQLLNYIRFFSSGTDIHVFSDQNTADDPQVKQVHEAASSIPPVSLKSVSAPKSSTIQNIQSEVKKERRRNI